MYYRLISINWTGQALSDEQLLVLRNVAAAHLRKGGQNAVINFAHALCEGHIERRKEGAFGMFAGTFFHAHLGTVKGEPWTIDFLLPRGSEELVLKDDSIVISTRTLDDGTLQTRRVDAKRTHVAEAATIH